MIFKSISISFALLLSSGALDAGIIDLMRSKLAQEQVQQPVTMRVLLSHSQPGVILETKGKYKIYDPRTGQQFVSNFQGKRRYLQALSGGIRWGEEFPDVHQILIVPDSSEATILIDSVEYPGVIYAYDVGGSISIVNKVTIEEYLRSVLSQQYRDALPDELLAAIAIVARTNSHYKAQNGKTPYWDVDGELTGYGCHGAGRHSRAMEKAVNDTKGMVLCRTQNGEWNITPFAIDWMPTQGEKLTSNTIYSAISLLEAAQYAQKGLNAAEILAKAFPDTKIQFESSTQLR